jgi:putative hydrolase of the HAD superfamily
MPNEYPEFLKRLRGRYKIGLVSNFDHSPAVWKILDKFGVRDLFDTVVISADLGFRKPNARLYETVLAAWGAAPNRTLFVGDTPKADVLGPKRLGLAAAWVRSGDGAFPADYPQPDWTCERVDELAEILLG